MEYEGSIYRPPSEAYSLIIQVTVGCSHNSCTFCSMYREKQFHVRPVDAIVADLQEMRLYYSRVGRIFLADGDAMCLSTDKLLLILDTIRRLFPECERVGIYGAARDILSKTPEELARLKEAGLGIIYLGAESGSPKVLENIHKDASAEQLIEAVIKSESAGLHTSVTFISGMGGPELWEEHAVLTGQMISKMQPHYASLLTLMLEPEAPLYKSVQNGDFKLLGPSEILDETELLIKNINVEKTCIFRSNHASNYLVLKGNLPEDKELFLNQIEAAKNDPRILRSEFWRAL